MDNITLAWLTEVDACFEARTAFVNIFGEAGEPTPHEVFAAAAKLDRRDWTSWLVQNVPGILAGLSITDGPIKAVGGGTIEVNNGYVYAYGSATVHTDGSATVLLGWYSRRVTLSIVGPNACVLDRRDGPPRLILANATTGTLLGAARPGYRRAGGCSLCARRTR